MAIEAQKTAAAAQKQLQNDVDAIKQYNDSLGEINDRVLPVLNEVSGLALGPNPLAWQKWFVDLLGYQLNQLRRRKPPRSSRMSRWPTSPQPMPISAIHRPDRRDPNELLRGWHVGADAHRQTAHRIAQGRRSGPDPEHQDRSPWITSRSSWSTTTRPARHSGSSWAMRHIVSSHFHRFWKAGTGWVMARDLKEGDPIRTLNGTVKVTAIDDGKVVPVFNLDVAGDADFFVGKTGALAHDNTLPSLREEPFDSPAAASKVSTR